VDQNPSFYPKKFVDLADAMKNHSHDTMYVIRMDISATKMATLPKIQ
jgi:hypothetical protein